MLERYELILKHERKKDPNDPDDDFEKIHDPLHVKFIFDPELEDRIFVLNMYFEQLMKYDSGVDRRLNNV